MHNLDDKTMIPLAWFAGIFMIGVSVTATGAFWVFRVDDRLSRIEDKLGIDKIARIDGSEDRSSE